MKPLLWFLVVIPFFFSCRKKEFISCPNFEKVVGEWQCIDTETKDIIRIDISGKVVFIHNMERKQSFYYQRCELKSGSTGNYFHFSRDEGSLMLRINQFFDTITSFSGGYEHNPENIEYETRFVKKQ
ncbi:MAG: hypothetical protein EP305_13170 [Bacteroidetes bacterium]|nr:MAG: hypothetical protein EP305_13170 [Bacteroidota bacterium]